MSLNIKNEETHRRAKELARETGESMTVAVDRAIRERLERVRRLGARDARLDRLLAIARESASAPIADSRPADELLYDDYGLPK